MVLWSTVWMTVALLRTWNFQSMVRTVVLGGEGKPVNTLDQCCCYHDLCYGNLDLCEREGVEVSLNYHRVFWFQINMLFTNFMYIWPFNSIIFLQYFQHGLQVKYKWEKEKEHGRIICLDTYPSCPYQVCDCDIILANCLRYALDNGAQCPHKFKLKDIMERVANTSL